jgi:hypothetical protein|tara:strand:+ start:209 stop:790 length:582 start_codon:yes stop_codon:yes gene_type:complete
MDIDEIHSKTANIYINRDRKHYKILCVLDNVKKTILAIENQKKIKLEKEFQKKITEIIQKINDDDLWLKEDVFKKYLEDYRNQESNISEIMLLNKNYIIEKYRNLDEINNQQIINDMGDYNYMNIVISFNLIKVENIEGENIYICNDDNTSNITLTSTNNKLYNIGEELILYDVFKKIANEIITEDKFKNKDI